jgi:hypothetical protein
MAITSGAKAPVSRRLYAALKGRSSTVGVKVLPQRLKPGLIRAGDAGLKACSTPQWIRNGNRKSLKACSILAETQQSWKQAAFAPTGAR